MRLYVLYLDERFALSKTIQYFRLFNLMESSCVRINECKSTAA